MRKNERNAKELCSLLITRGLKKLSEEEEEKVVDYLENAGIKVKLDETPRELCLKLLDLSIREEGQDPKKVPITAYANTLLGKQEEKREERKRTERPRSKSQDKEIERRRKIAELEGKSKTLPGCTTDKDNILGKNLFTLKVDPEIGLMFLPNNDLQYSAVISFNQHLYNELFTNYDNPLIELNSNKGYRAYARVVQPHDEGDNLIYISPLVAASLKIENTGGAFAKVCVYLPQIKNVKFTYLGSKEKLNKFLPQLIENIPYVIDAFSYLSLGMILKTRIQGEDVEIRVDEILDEENQPIYVGLIPFGENEIPFEIEAED